MSSFFRIWLAGLRTGAATLPRDPMLGLKRLLLPASYWRTAEFAYVWQRIAPARGMRLLDLGSPKDLAAFLARDAGCEVVACDILPEAIALSRRYAAAQGIEGAGPGRVQSEVQDGRNLPYADGSFDAAFSVSVLEHIPERGDSDAIRELVRVVKPGGRIVLTVPYDRTHRDTYVDGGVYERSADAGARTFFERHYDAATLRERLLEPSGARVVDLQLWGEPGLSGERLLGHLGPLRTALSPVESLLAAAWLAPVAEGGDVRPMAAFVTLEKPAA